MVQIGLLCILVVRSSDDALPMILKDVIHIKRRKYLEYFEVRYFRSRLGSLRIRVKHSTLTAQVLSQKTFLLQCKLVLVKKSDLLVQISKLMWPSWALLLLQLYYTGEVGRNYAQPCKINHHAPIYVSTRPGSYFAGQPAPAAKWAGGRLFWRRSCGTAHPCLYRRRAVYVRRHSLPPVVCVVFQ